MRVTGGPRRWRAVTAVALCASALFVTGCGDSAADKEAACWTKHEAIASEMAAVAAMTFEMVDFVYGNGSGRVLTDLRKQLPDC